MENLFETFGNIFNPDRNEAAILRKENAALHNKIAKAHAIIRKEVMPGIKYATETNGAILRWEEFCSINRRTDAIQDIRETIAFGTLQPETRNIAWEGDNYCKLFKN